MNIIKSILILLPLVAIFQCTNAPSDPTGTDNQLMFSPDNGGLVLPAGFKAIVVADSVGRARHITVRENGDIYVALRELKNGAGIVALRDTNRDGVADQTGYFGETSGTGIDIFAGNLYFSSTTEVFRVPLDDNLVPVGKVETVVSGFPDQQSHAAKSFTIDDHGNLYVNVGGPSNACMEEARTTGSVGLDPCPQLEWQGGIWMFDATEINQEHREHGYHYATGIRNAVALDWNASADALYGVQHGRDQLNTLWPDYYTEEDNALIPSEDFFLIEDGANFGWPYTYFDGLKNQRMIAPEYGGDGVKTAEPGQYEAPILTFPGHWAPNDLIFYDGAQFPDRYRRGAFVAFHGSWNRAPQPQAGYNITFVPMSGGQPSADYEIFADGFPGIESFTAPSDARSRPTGVAEGPDGSLYISDSVKGKIWRIVYVGLPEEENVDTM